MGMRRQTRESLVALRTQIRHMRFPGLQANRQISSPLQTIQSHRVQPRVLHNQAAAVSPESELERKGHPELEPTPVVEAYSRELTPEDEAPAVGTNLVSSPVLLQQPVEIHQPQTQRSSRIQECPILHPAPALVHRKGFTVITGYDRIGQSSTFSDPNPEHHRLQTAVNHIEQQENTQLPINLSLEEPNELPPSSPPAVSCHREFLSPSPIPSSSGDLPTPTNSQASSSQAEDNLSIPLQEASPPLRERTSNIQILLPHAKIQEQKSGYVERCQMLAAMFEASAASTSDSEEGPPAVTVSRRALQRFGNTIQVWEPSETITADRADTGVRRTFGTVRYAGSEKMLIGAISGWRIGATGNPKLLDGNSWVKAVLEFCRIVKHELPPNAYDGIQKGQFAACHVEKRLGLWFVFRHIADEATGLPCREKLEKLRQESKLKAIIEMDKAPCLDCRRFLEQLGRFTNVKFDIEVMMELGQVERYTKPGTTKVTRHLVHGGSKKVATVKYSTHRLELNRTVGGRVAKSKMASLARVPWFASDDAIDEPESETESDESSSIVRPLRYMSLTRSIPHTAPEAETPEINRSSSEGEGSSQLSGQYSSRNSRRASLPDNVFSFDALNCLDRRRAPRALGSYRNPVMIDDSDSADEAD